VKKIEASTLEEAYSKACKELECSFEELKYEIIQYPKKGLIGGLFAKSAIIVATIEKKIVEPIKEKEPQEEIEKIEKEVVESKPKEDLKETPKEPILKQEESKTTTEVNLAEDKIIDNFFQEQESQIDEKELERVIENKIKELLQNSCFNIDVVEVDIIDGIVHIFIDGDDAALLIGKEGYRYNALSYLLYSWIYTTYQRYIKLEIAQFLSSQEELVKRNLEPVVEHIKEEGRGKTRPMEGVLIQIALEYLRKTFPNKYVAIKRNREGERYILINDFNKRQ